MSSAGHVVEHCIDLALPTIQPTVSMPFTSDPFSSGAPPLQQASSGRDAGPSRPAAALAARQQAAAVPAGRRRPRPAAAAAPGSSSGGDDIIDLTSDSPPTGADDVQVVRSTVVPRQPMRGAKRPRTAAVPGLPPAVAGLSPAKQLLLARLYNPPPPPPPEPEPEGPKCGICMEVGAC